MANQIVTVRVFTANQTWQDVRLVVSDSDWNVLQPIYAIWQQGMLTTQTWIIWQTDPVRGRMRITFPTTTLESLFQSLTNELTGGAALAFSGDLIIDFVDGVDMRGNWGFAMGSPVGPADGMGPASD
jgi:hypothetical protein